ncbi:hypothetical protein Tco_0602324 [Tanacetum coccineum]
MHVFDQDLMCKNHVCVIVAYEGELSTACKHEYIQAQPKCHEDSPRFAPADRLEFGKCNMRLKTDIKPKEAIFQVELDALTLTLFYRAFLITTDVPAIYMQEFWATVFVLRSSIRFTIKKKKVSLNVDIFKDILLFCTKIPRQVFEDLPLEQDILSFIKDLGHTRDITYLTDVNVDYLHQPWRAFATIINKCLSGKEIEMDNIRLSHAQILWGIFHKKNIDYVYLLWEDLLFQIEYKDAKKTNKMSYPKFTKIIIDYFKSNDPSISRRNKMFWHTARDDTLFTSMRCISRHEDTQVYGTILPTELTNHAMLESKAYQTYYAFASGKKALKSKYIREKADSDTSPKKKPVQATKGTRLKSKAKVAKPDKKKQPAKKTKEKSGSGDGVDTQSKSDDDDDDNDDERTEYYSDEVPDPNLTNVDQTEYEEEDIDNRVRTPLDYELTDEEKLDDEETMDDEEDDEDINELYDNADEPVQSSSASFDFTSKLLNLKNPSPADNEIASLLETSTHHATAIPEITSDFTTTTPTLTMVSALESEMSEFKQTNQFAKAVSSFLGIVDTYLASKMKEVVDVVVQLQTNKLREEAQAENQEFLNQVDSTIKTIIKDQVKA